MIKKLTKILNYINPCYNPTPIKLYSFIVLVMIDVGIIVTLLNLMFNWF